MPKDAEADEHAAEKLPKSHSMNPFRLNGHLPTRRSDGGKKW